MGELQTMERCPAFWHFWQMEVVWGHYCHYKFSFFNPRFVFLAEIWAESIPHMPCFHQVHQGALGGPQGNPEGPTPWESHSKFWGIHFSCSNLSRIDIPHALCSSNSLVTLSGPLGVVPGGRQGPVRGPMGGPKFDPDQKTSLGTYRDHTESF